MVWLEVTSLLEGVPTRTREEMGDHPVLSDVEEPPRRFRISHAVHGGGNGMVFEAQQLAADDTARGVCAVKMLKKLLPSSQDRFANELRILKGLSHRSISGFYGAGTYRGARGTSVPWYAMDLCGHNLRQHVMERGPLRARLLRHVALQLCDAVQYIHEKDLIHRDLKPANVVWADGDGANGVVKLIDFGIAKFVGEDVSGRPLDDFTKTMDFVGPVFFSSPELIAYAEDKGHAVDHRSDLFQLGKVLWFFGTGRILAGIPSERCDPIGGPLFKVVSWLIADDPRDRPDSAAVVRALIEAWQV